jgi:hypothetical protein
MLPEQITLPSTRSHPNSFPHTLFQTLGRCQKPQLLCNQANPHAFSKTPGVWVSLRSRAPHHPIFALPVFSRTYKSLPTSPSESPLCFHRLTNCPLCPIDFFLLCFHVFTNCFFSNPFAFTNICVAPCFFVSRAKFDEGAQDEHRGSHSPSNFQPSTVDRGLPLFRGAEREEILRALHRVLQAA